MILVILSLVPVALAISFPLVWLLARVGAKLGQVDTPGSEAHKQHVSITPNIGGIGIFAGLVGPLVVGLAAIWLVPVTAWTGPLESVAIHLPGLKARTPLLVALLVSLAVLHIMGLVDDRNGLPASLRLGIELLIGLALAYFFDVRVLQLLDQYGMAGTLASCAISALWVAVVINAMNMLDNMDGLASGVGIIIASLYLASTLMIGQWFVAALAALLLGALIGFWIWNFPPAKIFMGDGGSMVLGLTLAVLTVRTTYTQIGDANSLMINTGLAPSPDAGFAYPGPGPLPESTAWYGILMPLLLMAIPLYDLCSVCVIRISQGRSPFSGDRQHFSHRLIDRGLTTRTAVIIIYLCTFATGIGGVMLASLKPWQAGLVFAQAAAVILLLALLEFGPKAQARSDDENKSDAA